MRIEMLRTLSGPNIYQHQPVLVLTLDFGDLATLWRTARPGFTQRLLDVVPDAHDLQRQRFQVEACEATLVRRSDIGAMVAHVLVMLTERAGLGASAFQILPGLIPATVRIVLAYQVEQATRYLAQAAVDLVVALLHEHLFHLEERIAQARRIAAQTELGPSTRAIVAAAERRGIPTLRLNDAAWYSSAMAGTGS